jgi:hypothetical protein
MSKLNYFLGRWCFLLLCEACGYSLISKSFTFIRTTAKIANSVVRVTRVKKLMKNNAVVKNQFLIKYLSPKRDDFTLSNPLVKCKEELLIESSIAFVLNSWLLKFSAIGIVIFWIGSQSQIYFINGTYLRIYFAWSMSELLCSILPILW